MNMIKQNNIQQAFQALRSYEYEHVQEHKEKQELSRLRPDFLMGLTRFSCNLDILFVLFILSKKSKFLNYKFRTDVNFLTA